MLRLSMHFQVRSRTSSSLPAERGGFRAPRKVSRCQRNAFGIGASDVCATLQGLADGVEGAEPGAARDAAWWAVIEGVGRRFWVVQHRNSRSS